MPILSQVKKPSMIIHQKLWSDFCNKHTIKANAVPLFETKVDLDVVTKLIGKTKQRPVLKRSQEMESAMRLECSKLVSDYDAGRFNYDGIIYIMGAMDTSNFTPLYIGKAETLGKKDRNLSANIRRVDRETSEFARWGDNYAYHIGDLSAVVLPGHADKHKNLKYRHWADSLFDEYPTQHPRLRRQVYFWFKAWSNSDVGAWVAFGPTRLTFLEYQLIGLASAAFGDRLLNREGRNRD